MPRYTAAQYLDFWKSIPGTFESKKEIFGGPFVYAREMAARDAEMSDAEVWIRDADARAVQEAEIALKKAFEAYFANTPEGQEEGKWLNSAYWEWEAAGKPPKINVGGHPLRKQIFAAFQQEWLALQEHGIPMTMVIKKPESSRLKRKYAYIG